MGKEVGLHDEFFKKVLGKLIMARAFFKAYFPVELKPDTDFSQLSVVSLNTEHIRDTLNRRGIADILFQVPIKGKPAYLLIHAEHQSSLDGLTYLRTIHYATAALIDYKRLHPKEPLPPLISFIYFVRQKVLLYAVIRRGGDMT